MHTSGIWEIFDPAVTLLRTNGGSVPSGDFPLGLREAELRAAMKPFEYHGQYGAKGLKGALNWAPDKKNAVLEILKHWEVLP